MIYPSEVKATGHGLAAGTGKLGAFVGTVFLPIFQSGLGIYLTLSILASTLLLGWLFTKFMEQEKSKLLHLTKPISDKPILSSA